MARRRSNPGVAESGEVGNGTSSTSDIGNWDQAVTRSSSVDMGGIAKILIASFDRDGKHVCCDF